MDKSIAKLNDSELLERTKVLRNKEREFTNLILLHLVELDERRLYREAGYPSLFAYSVQALRYSKSAAYRRIQVARSVREFPELYLALEAGKLSLSTAAELTKIISKENADRLLAACSNKSQEEVESIVARESAPTASPRRERVWRVRVKPKREVKEVPLFAPNSSTTSVTSSAAELVTTEVGNRVERAGVEERYNLSLQLDAETMELLNAAKVLSRERELASVLGKVLKDYVERNSPGEREQSRLRRKAKRAVTEKPKSRNRHVPRATRDQVILRDGSQCTYVSADGVRCCERTYLQLDHIVPFALGGEHSEDNLRLLCSQHNRLEAERVYGKSFISRFASPS